ncbi:MAG: AraC family transcriptional regulator [Pseudomonadota bacterium]
MKPVAATPMAFVRMLLLAYNKYATDPAWALARAQITPEQLQQPGSTITSGQLETLAFEAMRELDDEALGWFSRRLPWGSYGMLARASLSAPDLGTALKRWCRHHALLADDVLLRLETHRQTATLTLSEQCPLGPVREFCTVTLLRNLHGVACWLIDSRIGLQQVELPFEAPAHAAVYPVLFPGPVQFGAARAALQFDARYLALPLRRDDKALDAMLAHALALIVRPYRRDRLLVQRVRTLLLSQPGASTADALAHALNVSTRTLHRQLQEEGASLQALKDDVRQSQAKELLGRGHRPVKQVALAVGFGNEKSFARAFRQWTGESPADYRLRIQSG